MGRALRPDPLGMVARSFSEYSDWSGWRKRALVEHCDIWVAAEETTVGWQCPTCDTLL